MRNTIVVILAAFGLSTPALSQQKAVHFKKLQEFLPSVALQGFERKKPTGQTQTAMGMTTSEAKVRYAQIIKEGEEIVGSTQSIEITISDMSGIPFGQMAAMAYQQDFENETEDGHERSVVLKGKYRGKETVQSGEYKRCELEFMVAQRFMLKFQADGTDDVKLLQKLVDSIDLEKLEKTTP